MLLDAVDTRSRRDRLASFGACPEATTGDSAPAGLLERLRHRVVRGVRCVRCREDAPGREVRRAHWLARLWRKVIPGPPARSDAAISNASTTRVRVVCSPDASRGACDSRGRGRSRGRAGRLDVGDVAAGALASGRGRDAAPHATGKRRSREIEERRGDLLRSPATGDDPVLGRRAFGMLVVGRKMRRRNPAVMRGHQWVSSWWAPTSCVSSKTSAPSHSARVGAAVNFTNQSSAEAQTSAARQAAAMGRPSAFMAETKQARPTGSRSFTQEAALRIAQSMLQRQTPRQNLLAGAASWRRRWLPVGHQPRGHLLGERSGERGTVRRSRATLSGTPAATRRHCSAPPPVQHGPARVRLPTSARIRRRRCAGLGALSPRRARRSTPGPQARARRPPDGARGSRPRAPRAGAPRRSRRARRSVDGSR